MSFKHKIAARAAREVRSGDIINLGIGIPTLVAEFLPPDLPVCMHAENGILGLGEACGLDDADCMLVDAGGGYVSTRSGASFFDSAVSFALIRSGRLDIAFLGTLEVAANGDLANWLIPGKLAPGIGGGMELAQKANRLVVTTTHTTRKGAPKIIPECTLPLTAKACVDLIVTELAVIKVTPEGLALRELAEGVELQEVLDKTGAPLRVPEGEIPVF